MTEYNATQPSRFSGLVQLGETERRLNGSRSPQPRRIDWEAQYANALDKFERIGFLLLVDDRQVAERDDDIRLRHDNRVTLD